MHRDISRARYDAVAIALHWVMAAGILALIAIGLTMAHATLAPARLFSLYQLHKSIGITILLAAVLRLAWRLTHRPPPLPATMPAGERSAAAGAHWLLYALLLGIPLSGWALVSASPLGIPTVLYGIVPWPHLPFFADLADKASAEKTIAQIHAWAAYVLAATVLLHAAAAFRHHFALRDDVLTRMLPRLRSRRNPTINEAQP